MAWTDEDREKVKQMYLAKDPTPENSMEIVQEIAEEVKQSPNGVRSILSKMDIYVKVTPATNAATSGSTKLASKRVSKADQQQAMADAIESIGGVVDMEIISKLSGKAAQYVADQIVIGSEKTPEETTDED